MSTFKVGEASVTRVEETYGACYPLTQIFPDAKESIVAEHAHWLAPHHYDAERGLIKLSVHSWVLRVGGKTILIDSCCGNNKDKPGRPWWHRLNVPYLERLAAAGVKPEDVDMVMCTHLHHDHVGWNTRLDNGRWVPTFPKARYVFSKPDFDYYRELDADPKEGPAELGTFREAVLPIVEAGRADLITGPHRLDEHIEITPAPGHSAGHVVFTLESRGARGVFIGDVFHHLLQVYYPQWNFPKNSDAEQARVSRRMVLEHCASSQAVVFPGHVGAPFAGRIEATATEFEPRFG